MEKVQEINLTYGDSSLLEVASVKNKYKTGMKRLVFLVLPFSSKGSIKKQRKVH